MIRAHRLLLFLVAVLLLGTSPYAYEEAEKTGKGAPLRWRNGPIKIAISSSISSPNSSLKSDSDVVGALRRSLQKWEDVADVSFKLVTTDVQNVSPPGTAGDGVSVITIAPTSENVLMFGRSPGHASAVTRVFFDRRNQITEADIVLNPTQQFSTDLTFGTFDLETILTHEIGHLLGLDHSFMPSAVMFEDQPKNSYFGQTAVSSRSLSSDDVSKVRSIYGAGLSELECCGRISGRFAVSNKQIAPSITVWAEDSKTGVVAQAAGVRNNGTFSLTGLSNGKYEVFYQPTTETGEPITSGSLGKIDIDQNDATVLPRRIGQGKVGFDLQFIGLNGQLSRLPVRLSSGRTYILFVGGRNLDPKAVSVGFNSPHISVNRYSTTAHDYGKGLSVISVEVRIEQDVAAGQYSIFVESETGIRRYIAGAISVD